MSPTASTKALRRFTFGLLLGLPATIAAPSICLGHDLWLLPEVRSSGEVVVRARQGDDFPGNDEAPRAGSFAGSMSVVGPSGLRESAEMTGEEPMSRLFRFRAAEEGIYVVGVETTPKVIKLSGSSFNDYLVENGLLSIYRQRIKEGRRSEQSTEQYQKSVKTLVRVGFGRGEPDKPLGHRLEIVPAKSPFEVAIGRILSVRVLFQGAPLPEAVVIWDLAGAGPEPEGMVRTNQQGEAFIPITREGWMSLKLIHLTQSTAAEVDWRSFWATLTFEVPPETR